MTYLLTGLGTLVCRRRADGALVHRPLDGAAGDADALDIGDVTHAMQVGLGHFLRDDDASLYFPLESGPLQGWTAIRTEDRRSIALLWDGKGLSASPDSDGFVSAERDDWPATRFVPLSEADLTVLRGLLAQRWPIGPGMQPEAATMQPGFPMRVGALDLDLRWNLPFDTTDWPNRLTVSWDVWRIERLFRYRPLVYFVAFGDEATMRQFALAVESLTTVGGYDGDIVVVTDKSPAEIAALFPAGMPERLAVLPMRAADRVGYIAARLSVAGWRDAWQFQPLLYVDADILFDCPVAPMLCEIARSDRICAASEAWNLAESEFVGSHLLADDNCHPAPDQKGFNAGTLGIPNMASHAGTLEPIGRTLRNRLAVVGRHTVQFVDQPIANYVSFRVAHFDTALLNRFVRLANKRTDPEGRTGLVHFCWLPGAAARVAKMEDYLERLRSIG
jgi:hypothetical protein